MKKIVSGTMLTLLLIGTLTFVFNRADGLVGRPTTRVMREQAKSGDFVTQLGTDWWPMFHHDLSHTGYSISKATPNTNNTIWNYTTGSYVYSSPAVADGIVYVYSMNGGIYSLDALTGIETWSEPSFVGGFSYSSPAVADGKIYVGTGPFKSISCLNASTGERKWNYMTGGTVYSCPTVAGSLVYAGSFDRNVYCLSASDGDLMWNYTTGGYVQSSPAVADGKVYIGSLDKHVYCLNALGGTQIWNYTTGSGVESSPAVADGKVYVGSADGKVYCLNASTGTHIWNYTTNGNVHSSPAVADGKVYVGSADGKVYCLDALNGTQIWNYTTGGSVRSSPAVADGKVYVGSDDNNVYCLNASIGESVWNYTTESYVQSSPAVADGKVYVASWDRTIYAFRDPCHDVAVAEVRPWKNAIGQNCCSFVDVTVKNPGTFAETFNVTVYSCSGGKNETKTFTDFPPNGEKTETFTWNTTGIVKGSCNVSASAWHVPGEREIDFGNNDYTCSNVNITIPGDVTGDIWVDMQDVSIIAGWFMTSLPNWNLTDCGCTNSDVNDDLSIDMADLSIAVENFMIADP